MSDLMKMELLNNLAMIILILMILSFCTLWLVMAHKWRAKRDKENKDKEKSGGLSKREINQAIIDKFLK